MADATGWRRRADTLLEVEPCRLAARHEALGDEMQARECDILVWDLGRVHHHVVGDGHRVNGQATRRGRSHPDRGRGLLLGESHGAPDIGRHLGHVIPMGRDDHRLLGAALVAEHLGELARDLGAVGHAAGDQQMTVLVAELLVGVLLTNGLLQQRRRLLVLLLLDRLGREDGL